MGQRHAPDEPHPIEAVTIDTQATTGGLAVAVLAVASVSPAPERVPELLAEVAAAVEGCAADPAVGAIVITKQDGGLAPGAVVREPLPEMDAMDATAYALRGQEGLAAIVDCRLPVIAAIEGNWVNVMVEIALACDVRIAARGALLEMPGVSAIGGAACFGGLTRLTHLVGPGRAKWLGLAGQPITADIACQAGLVEELAQPGEALRCALAFAGRVAAAPPFANAALKAAVNRATAEMDVARALRWEAAVFGQAAEDGEARAWRTSQRHRGAASSEGDAG